MGGAGGTGAAHKHSVHETGYLRSKRTRGFRVRFESQFSHVLTWVSFCFSNHSLLIPKLGHDASSHRSLGVFKSGFLDLSTFDVLSLIILGRRVLSCS